MSKKEEGSRGIQSVVTGMKVLSAVAANRGPSTLSSISQLAELSASQTHRYLSSLIKSNMVRQDEKSGLYDLDAGAIRIGLAALSGIDVFQMAGDVLANVAAETSYTCLLSVWGDAGPTVVRWYYGRPAVVTSIAVGSVLPLLSSATGMIFYAFGDENLIHTKFTEELVDMGWKESEFEKLREQVRANMWAEVSGDFIPGLRGISAPIFDIQGRLVLAATLVAGAGVPKSKHSEAQKVLLRACHSITETMGGAWVCTKPPEPA